MRGAARRLLGRHPGDGSLDRIHRCLVMGWLSCPACSPAVPDVVIEDGRDRLTARQLYPRPDVPGGYGFAVFDPATGPGREHDEVVLSCLRHPAVRLARSATAGELSVQALCTLALVDRSTVFGTVTWTSSGPHDGVVIVRLVLGARDVVSIPARLRRATGHGAVVDSAHDFTVSLPGAIPAGQTAVRLEIVSPATGALLHAEDARVPSAEPAEPWALTAIGEDDTDLAALRQSVRAWAQPEWAATLTRRSDAWTGRATQVRRLVIRDRLEGAGLSVAALAELAAGLDPGVRELVLAIDALPRDGVPRSLECPPGQCAVAVEPVGPGPFALTRLEEAYLTWSGAPTTAPADEAGLQRLLVGFARWLRPLREAAELIPPGHLTLLLDWAGPGPQAGHGGAEPSRTSESEAPHGVPADAGPIRLVIAGMRRHESGLGHNVSMSVEAVGLLGGRARVRDFDPTSLLELDPDPALPGDAALGAPDAPALVHLPVDRMLDVRLRHPDLWRRDKVIGYLMWETSEVPSEMRVGLDAVDEIWTGSRYCRDVFAASTDRPVHVVGHAVEIGDVQVPDRAELGIGSGDFVAHFAFDAHSSLARKNPIGAVLAFTRAFAGDDRSVLLLKVRNWASCEAQARTGSPYAREFLRLVQGDPRIRLVTDELPRPRTLGLIAVADCVLSLHRSEGFGYSLAEAMAMRVPVVATGYSGNTDFCTSATSWLVPCELVPVPPASYFARSSAGEWAEPSVSAAAEQLVAVREGDGVEERCTAAQALIARDFSLSAMSARYGRLLGDAD